MRNIIITGFMGTGKSSVGRLIAQRLSLTFIDTDEIIEQETGLSINDIFREFGEDYFRSLEKRTIKELRKKRGLIIATGGGAIIDPENLKLLKESGTLVCLTASPESIYERVNTENNRPLLSGENRLGVIKRLMKEREEFYKQADIIVDSTKKKIEDVADEVLRQIGILKGKPLTFIEVSLGERSYPIYFSVRGFKKMGSILKNHRLYKRLGVITNPTIKGLYGEEVIDGLKNEGFEPIIIEIPDGERYKTLKWVSKIYDELLEHCMDRNSPLLALGGGVIGDITGFVAATYLRGVPYVQIPTTLLSQVDSSVGGKTGVNHPQGKNLIGAFYQPRLVFIDIAFLNTIKKREFRSGLAEVVKYGAIKDRLLFNYLEDNIEKILALHEESLLHIIKRSCEIKAAIVEKDEKEQGIRAILNFGHTFGHAIETATNYKRFRHGEAISMGMVLSSRLSHKMGLCSHEVTERIEGLLSKAGLPVKNPPLNAEEILKRMTLDKKVLKGRLRLVLIKDIGDVIVKEVDWRDFSLDLESILK